MRSLKKSILFLFTLMILALPLVASELEDLKSTMQSKVDETVKTLKNPKLLREQQDKKITQLADGMFDYKLMAKLSIGKRNWKKFSPAQRKEFVNLFVLRMKESYAKKAHLLGDEKITVEDAVQVKPKRVYLRVLIHGSKNDTDIKYKYYKTKRGKWLIYDVEIAKISILQTYRAQFAEVLSNKSVDDLLKELKKPKTEQRSS